MKQEIAEAFIRFFSLKYFPHLFPQEVLDVAQAVQSETIYTPELQNLLTSWENKISIQSHWEGVIEDFQSERDLNILSCYKIALFKQQQLLIEYQEDDKRHLVFNPFGLVIRNENFFFVGSNGDSQNPILLSQNKMISLQLLEQPAVPAREGFNLAEFAENYLNHPVSPEIIENLVVEFPIKAYFYVKSHPIKCEQLYLTEPAETPGYFHLVAKNVANTIRLHQWFSGFHDDAQILEPIYLRKLINRSFVDQLTNLYNRKAFDRLGQREIELCFRYTGQVFSLLIIDIDHFKTINDRHGHLFGDEVLIHVSECLRDYDAIRYGGEEFVILLSNTNAADAQKVAERIRENISNLVMENEYSKQVPITISIGIAEFPRHLSEQDAKIFHMQGKSKLVEKDKHSLMQGITEQSDKALYFAKMNGRNQSIIFSDGI